MADLHVTFDLLAAADEGRITRQELVDLLARHLFSLCPTCSSEHDAFRDARERDAEQPVAPEETAAFSPEDYDRVILATAERTLEIQEVVRRDERRAPAELRRLLALPPEEALGRIERARTRFRSAALAEALLAEIRDSLPERPRRALALAELAEAVARRLLAGGREVPLYRAECRALALAHQGNALRALDDLREAEERFSLARDEADREGVTDPSVLSEIDALQASLQRDRRRFDAAAELLSRALALALVAEDPLQVTSVLIQSGVLHQQQGRPDRALAFCEAARQALPADAPPRLVLAVHHNRAIYLAELNEPELAEATMAEARRLYERFDDPWTASRHRWLQGKIARGLGHPDTAIQHMQEARDGFAAGGHLYDAALASLELTELLLESGRTREARRTAGETLPMFAGLDIRREAAAALAQLRRALREERKDTELSLSVALIRRIVEVLEAGRRI